MANTSYNLRSAVALVITGIVQDVPMMFSTHVEVSKRLLSGFSECPYLIGILMNVQLHTE